MSAGALISASDLTRRFGSFVAVDKVSFDVSAGEVVGLLGANGAGKTTAIRMLLGLLRPSAGSSRLLGVEPDLQSRRRLGYVPQGLGLYRDLTVKENLSFSADAYGVRPARLPDGLAQSGDVLVDKLPLGLQRRLAFLIAIQHSPAVLVLDEPTSGVAPLAASRLWDTIRVQAGRGVGVLVSTHYMQEAAQCDRLLLMAQGRLIAEGTEADLVRDTSVVEAVTDDWPGAFAALRAAGALVTLAGRSVRVVDADPAMVLDVLRAAGIAADVRPVRARLEERMASLASAA